MSELVSVIPRKYNKRVIGILPYEIALVNPTPGSCKMLDSVDWKLCSVDADWAMRQSKPYGKKDADVVAAMLMRLAEYGEVEVLDKMPADAEEHRIAVLKRKGWM